MTMSEDTAPPQCTGDPDCPREARADRGGMCWWHDLNGTTHAEAARDGRLRGSYSGNRGVMFSYGSPPQTSGPA